jgi:hypothetical protein
MKAHSELIRCYCSIDCHSGQGSLTFPASSVGVENLQHIYIVLKLYIKTIYLNKMKQKGEKQGRRRRKTEIT